MEDRLRGRGNENLNKVLIKRNIGDRNHSGGLDTGCQ